MKQRRAYLQYMNFGWQMLGGAGLLTFFGMWLDKMLNSRVWTVGGVFLGIVYCGILIRNLVKETESEGDGV